MSKGLSVEGIKSKSRFIDMRMRVCSQLAFAKIKKILTGKVFKHFVNGPLSLSCFKLLWKI